MLLHVIGSSLYSCVNGIDFIFHFLQLGLQRLLLLLRGFLCRSDGCLSFFSQCIEFFCGGCKLTLRFFTALHGLRCIRFCFALQ